APVSDPRRIEGINEHDTDRNHAEPATGRADASDLNVKRLVVASGVKDREPYGTSNTFEVGKKPVFAFVEIANRSSHDGDIVIVFEKGSTRRGWVQLDVPAGSGRWRTWGYTRGLVQAGTWVVVVREKASGKKLASTTIEVIEHGAQPVTVHAEHARTVDQSPTPLDISAADQPNLNL
ncbi:MAG: hypothetical protein CSA75_02200, partial [Sorangium cellulosum]